SLLSEITAPLLAINVCLKPNTFVKSIALGRALPVAIIISIPLSFTLFKISIFFSDIFLLSSNNVPSKSIHTASYINNPYHYFKIRQSLSFASLLLFYFFFIFIHKHFMENFSYIVKFFI